MSGSVFAAAVLILIVLVGGCGSGSGKIAVTLSPGTAQALDQGQSVTVTAVVAHDSNHEGVSWALTSGPGALTNTSTTSATYSANGATGTAVVTATSIKDKAKTATLNVTVTAMPSITTTSLPASTEGTAYSQAVTMTGGAGTATFSISAGSLPAGLSLSSSGTISGTPAGPNQTSNFTVKVTDASTVAPQSATQALSITVNLPAPPSITTTSLAAGVEGTAYSQTIAATGGMAPLTFSTSAGSLPPGLTMGSTGAITGTPTGPNGTSNFTVKVTDSSNPPQTATQPLSIQINLPAPPVISPTTLPGGNVGTPYSQTLTGSSGLAPYSWNVSAGALPAGLGLTTSTGTTATISGTPTTQQSNVAFTIQVTDSSNPSQHGTQAYTVTIGAPLPLSITTTSSQLPAGSENVAYTTTSLTATGGVAPYTWSVVSPGTGALPTGMSLSSGGQLSGTPTVTGTFPFTAEVTDSTNATATANLSITINAVSTECESGNESALKGQYAFILKGATADGFLAAVGSFTADGNGNITAGYVDASGQQTSNNGLGVQSGAVTATGSSYSMGSDYRGCATIVTPFYTFITRFAIPPSSSGNAEGTIQEFEPPVESFIGSGQIFQQQVPATVPTGNWVHNQSGAGPYSALMVTGVDVYASGGQITNGEYDCAGYGCAHESGVTGTYTASNPTTGRYTLTTTLNSVSLNRAAYLVSPTQILVITTSTSTMLAGEMQLQSGSLTLSGKLISFGMGADTVQFATMTAASSSFTANVYEDYNGTLETPAPEPATCSYTIDSYGWVSASGSNCNTSYTNTGWNGAPLFYLTGPNTGFMLETAGGIQGQLAPQTATTITAGNYYFGTYAADIVWGQGWDSATGVASATSTSVTGTSDAPGEPNQPFSYTLTVNSDGTFSSSNHPGVVIGVIISSSQVISADQVEKAWPGILVFNADPSGSK